MSDEAGFATPSADPQAALRPRRNWGALVVALVIGLVVGTGGATLVWTLAGSEEPAAGAEGDVTMACSLIRRATWGSNEDEPLVEDFSRWNAARLLVVSAAHKDPRYRPLGEALDDGAGVVTATYKAKGTEFEKYAQKARAFCDGL